MFQPLSDSLQTSVRFFFHPLPSREFGLCYLGQTQEYSTSLRLCGVYPVVSLSFSCSLLDASYSATSFRSHDYRTAHPLIHSCTFWLEPFSLIWLLSLSRSLNTDSLSFIIREFPSSFLPLLGWQLDYVCGLHSVFFVTYWDVTGLK